MHYIPTKNLEKLILNVIRRISWYVQESEKELIQKVRELSSIQQEESVKACKRKLRQSEKRYAELDGLVKKLYESNATGKLSDRHFERLLADYDNEQSELETVITELATQISTWSEDKLKTEKFIELVKRYTDFSELTTPMLNEFVERVYVHEGIGRGKARRQRVDIHFNFIGAFDLPADFITPMEIEEQRQAEEEQAEKARLRKEREKERYTAKNEKARQKNKEFQSRKKAGLLTPEEEAAYQARLEYNRMKNKEWRDKRDADLPPKPPKPLTLAQIAERVKEGLPLTEEETAKHEAYKARKNAQFKRWRAAKKASEPPKPPKLKVPTKKERYNDIAKRKKAGLPITQEEQELHEAYREERRVCHKKWRDSQAQGADDSLAIADIKKRIRDNLPLTPEQTAFHAEWKAKTNEYRREHYHTKKAEMAVAVGQ